MSKIINSVHRSAKRLHAAGAMDAMTMREFDALCLPPVRVYGARDVKRIRKAARASQSVFAAFFNVGKTTVAAWEQGTKKPSGAAARLLDIVERKGLEAIA